VNRWVQYHRDGTIRMDYYTFRNIKADKVYEHLTSTRALRVVPRKGRVREFK
jgi:hypothetical protein